MDWPDTCKATARRTKASDMSRLIMKGRCGLKEKARECAATCRLDNVQRVYGVRHEEMENGKRMYLSQLVAPSL